MSRCLLSISSSSSSVSCHVVSSLSSKELEIRVNPRQISMKKILSEALLISSLSRLQYIEQVMKSKLKTRAKKGAAVNIKMLGSCLMISTTSVRIQVSIHAMSGELQVSNCDSFSSLQGRYERLLREAEMFKSNEDKAIGHFIDLILFDDDTTTSENNIYEF